MKKGKHSGTDIKKGIKRINITNNISGEITEVFKKCINGKRRDGRETRGTWSLARNPDRS